MKMLWMVLLCWCFLTVSCYTNPEKFVARPVKKNQDHFPKALLLNGIYAGFPEDPGSKEKGLLYFIFYENGIALNKNYYAKIPDPVKANVDSLKAFLRDNTRVLKEQNGFNAGGYELQGTDILIQVYGYVPGSKWGLYSIRGKVVGNDRIYVESCQLKERPGYCREKYYLNFVQIEKPDSTTRLMKKKWYWRD